MRTKEEVRKYNRAYYLKNKKRLIKKSCEYQKNPINAEKRRTLIRIRYKTNDKGFRDKNLKSHDNCKKDIEWVKKKRLLISIWGMSNRNTEGNSKRAKKYYKKNKEKIKEQKKNASSQKIAYVLNRSFNNYYKDEKDLKKDIKILKQEIARIKNVG